MEKITKYAIAQKQNDFSENVNPKSSLYFGQSNKMDDSVHSRIKRILADVATLPSLAIEAATEKYGPRVRKGVADTEAILREVACEARYVVNGMIADANSLAKDAKYLIKEVAAEAVAACEVVVVGTVVVAVVSAKVAMAAAQILMPISFSR